MKNKVLHLFLGIMLSFSVAAQNNPIIVGADGKSWDIVTRSSGYRLEVSSRGEVNAAYYGNRLNLERPGGTAVPEILVRGGFVSLTPLLEVIFPDGVHDIELMYKSYEITDMDGYPVLKIST